MVFEAGIGIHSFHVLDLGWRFLVAVSRTWGVYIPRRHRLSFALAPCQFVCCGSAPLAVEIGDALWTGPNTLPALWRSRTPYPKITVQHIDTHHTIVCVNA